MTGYKFGDIVLVPFPFTDQSAVKRRPAVVISSTAYHRTRPDIQSWPSPVSAHRRCPWVQVQDWKDAGLLNPSVLKPVLTTIDPTLILRKLGQLTPAHQTLLRQALNRIIG